MPIKREFLILTDLFGVKFDINANSVHGYVDHNNGGATVYVSRVAGGRDESLRVKETRAEIQALIQAL